MPNIRRKPLQRSCSCDRLLDPRILSFECKWLFFFPCVFRIRIFLRFEKIFLFFTNNRVTYRSINRLWRLAESMGIKIHISLHFGMDNFVRFLLIPSTCSSFVRMLEGYLWVSRTEMESFTELAREFHPTFRDTEGIVTSHVEKMFPAETCVRALSPHVLYASLRSFYRKERKKKMGEKWNTR